MPKREKNTGCIELISNLLMSEIVEWSSFPAIVIWHTTPLHSQNYSSHVIRIFSWHPMQKILLGLIRTKDRLYSINNTTQARVGQAEITR